MTWDYRIMHYREHPEFGTAFGIHEVFYDQDGSVKGATKTPVAVVDQDLVELEWRLRAMLEALQKPALDYESADYGYPGEREK